MARIYWKGGTGGTKSDPSVQGNWCNEDGTAVSNTDWNSGDLSAHDIVFDHAKNITGSVACIFDGSPSTHTWKSLTVKYKENAFYEMIQFGNSGTTLILSGMDIRQAETFSASANCIIKFTGVPYFASARRSVATTTGSLGGGNDDADLYIKIVGDVNTRYLRQESGGSALQQDSYKTAGMFKDETSRSKFTFLFEPPNNQILVLDDGIYPNMDFDCGGSDTATLAFDFCYTAGNNNRTNDFEKVDMLTLTIDSSFDVKPTDYNIINKRKHIIIRNGYDLDCSTFDMGYATLEIIPCISVTGANVASLYVPTNDTATFGPTPSGSQAMGMKTKYSTLIIGTPIDENSALFMKDNTILVCDDLIIKAGGRLYGSEREDENSTEIHCLKQPTVEGDWNFVQTSEGIYRAQGSTPTLPVSMGGTGLTSIGTQGQVLAVKSNGQGLEWRADIDTNTQTTSFYIVAEETNWDLTTGTSNGFHWSFGNGADTGDAPSANSNNEGIALPVNCTLKFMHLNLANDGNDAAGNSTTVQIYKAVSASASQSAVANAVITTTIATNGHGASNTADLDIDFNKGDIILFRSTNAFQSNIYLGRGTVSAFFVER